MKYREISTSLTGCQPTVEQLIQVWQQVLEDFQDMDRKIVLTYKSRRNIVGLNGSIRRESERIESDSLDKLFDEIGAWDVLDNLTLHASQEAPYRKVFISIGPGRGTTIRLEGLSDDHWLITGRVRLVKELSLTNRLRKLGRNTRKVFNKLSPPLAILLSVALVIGGSILVIVALFLSIAPVANLVHIYTHHGVPRWKDWAYSLCTVAVVGLVWQAFFSIVPLRISRVRRSRLRLFSPGTTATVIGIAGVVVAIIGIIIEALVK